MHLCVFKNCPNQWLQLKCSETYLCSAKIYGNWRQHGFFACLADGYWLPRNVRATCCWYVWFQNVLAFRLAQYTHDIHRARLAISIASVYIIFGVFLRTTIQERKRCGYNSVQRNVRTSDPSICGVNRGRGRNGQDPNSKRAMTNRADTPHLAHTTRPI